MTTPDVCSLAEFGGVKVNDYPVVDPQTDLDADEDNKARCSTAAMTHTAHRGWARFTTAATTGALALVAHDAMWGSLGGVAPTLARVSAGIFTLTWPVTVTDELGVTHSVNIRWSKGNHRSTSFRDVNVVPQSANTANVYVRDNTLALADVVGTDIDVWIG